MARTVIINPRLHLGDGLMTTPAIRAYKRMAAPGPIVMIAGREPHNDIFEHNPYIDSLVRMSNEELERVKERYAACKARLVRMDEEEYACIFDPPSAFNWCVANQEQYRDNGALLSRWRHLSCGFAQQLQVNLDDPHYDVVLTDEEYADGREYLKKYRKPVLLCAPLSRSCTSRSTKPGEENLPANVMLSSRIWEGVLQRAGTEFDFVFLAAAGEKLLDIAGATWEVGLPIRKVAAMCKAAQAVVSIDTGINHMAQSVDANIVSVCAALPRRLTSADATRGRYYCVDYTAEGDRRSGRSGWKEPIELVSAEDVLQGIRAVV